MNENSQNIIEAINESFLHNEEKRILTERLAQEWPSDTFFAAMNTFLVDELKKRGVAYEKVIEGFETGYNDLEKEYKDKKRELDTELDAHVSRADPADLVTKEKIFDQYCRNNDSIQVDYEKGVKELYSHLSGLIMKE